jgi:ParB family transcriptional regulator, chromosome partitioning protein
MSFPQQLELHQLTLRYEHLRKRHPLQERNLLTSLAEIGQQLPVVVVAAADGFVLIDGYKRLRALQRLGHDTVQVIQWQVAEVDALLLERGLRRGSEDIFDQAWLLAELRERFGWSLEEIGRSFEHGKSWVSSRLALIKILPQQIQEQVRLGQLSAHAAMKYLVPFARANAQAAQQLATAITPIKPTSREVGLLYEGWNKGTQKTRELILTSPHIYLKAQEAQEPAPPSVTEQFLKDLGALGGIARRAYRTLQDGLLQQLLESERLEVKEAFARTRTDLRRLIDRVELEKMT